MLQRIRKLMAVPFARPPWRRVSWAAVGPELCAAGLCCVFLIALWLLVDNWQPFLIAGIPTYLLGGAILLVVPVCLAAQSLAGEHDRGTMDALLLTSVSRRSVVWGRFWAIALPWTRLLLYMLPLYVLQAAIAKEIADDRKSVFLAAVYTGSCKPLFTVLIGEGPGKTLGFHWMALPLLAGRFLRDLLDLLFVIALSLYISARARGRTRAFVLCGLLVPALQIIVFSSADWVWALLRGVPGSIPLVEGVPRETREALFTVLAAVTTAVQAAATWWLVHRTARRFDDYALGERGAG